MSRSASLLDLEELPSREDRIGCGVSFPSPALLIFFFTGRLLESLNSQPSASSTAAQSARPLFPLSAQINENPPSSDCRRP